MSDAQRKSSGAAGKKRKFDSGSSSVKKTAHSNGSSSSSSSNKGGTWKKAKYDGKGGNGGGKGSWKKKDGKKKGGPVALTREDRDRLRKERKAAKPHADIIAEANKVWQLALSSMKASERQAKVESLLESVEGKIADIAPKHDASRALQLAAKYGSDAQKLRLLAELKGNLVAMSREQYGHYLIIKLISNDTRKGDVKKECMAEFKKHVVKMSHQPDSAKVLDFLFASVQRKAQAAILTEFYSPEFIIFADDPDVKDKTLGEILKAKPDKKTQILENIRKYLDKALEKNMIMFRFVHALLLQYLTFAPMSETAGLAGADAAFLSNLAQFVPALHHSLDGCRILCHLLSVQTTAKERKNILKHFKGLIPHMSERAESVSVLSCALDVVDDTVQLDKVIFSELLPHLADQVAHQHAAKIYVHILNPHLASTFSPDEKENYSVSRRWVLQPNDDTAASSSSNAADSSSSTNPSSSLTPLSKKAPQQKRLELLNLFLLPLLTTLATLPDTLRAVLHSTIGHQLCLEAIKEAWRIVHHDESNAAAADDSDVKQYPAALLKKLPELRQQLEYLFDSIVRECATPVDETKSAPTPKAKDTEEDEDGDVDMQPSPTSASSSSATAELVHPLEDRFGHYAIKRLITSMPSPPPHSFVSRLISDAIQPQLVALASRNRPAFVMCAILEAERTLPQAAATLRKHLMAARKEIEAAAQAPVSQQVEAKQEDGGKKRRTGPTTNAGIQLLVKLMHGQKGKKSNGSNVGKTEDDKPTTTPPPKTPVKQAKTPAKKNTTAKKKSAKKATSDDMEE